MKKLAISDYPLQSTDKVRYSDTDRQGHVNNAVFSTFLETGRVELLYQAKPALGLPDSSFVIASLHLDFLKEILWPGTIVTGTGIISIGNSSIHLQQQIFQEDSCAAIASTVVVQVSNLTRRSIPWSPEARQALEGLLLPQEA